MKKKATKKDLAKAKSDLDTINEIYRILEDLKNKEKTNICPCWHPCPFPHYPQTPFSGPCLRCGQYGAHICGPTFTGGGANSF